MTILPGRSVFFFPVMTPACHEAHDAVREHLGVDAEVAPAAEAREDGVGNPADPHLQRRAVADEARHVEADLPADVVDRLDRELRQRVVHRNEVGDLLDVDERVAVRPRHPRVHLGEDQPRGVDRGPDDVDRDAEAHETVPVGRADLDQGDVHGDAPARDDERDLREEDGHEVGPPLLDGLPDVRPDEERGVPEALLEAGGDVGRRPQRQEMDDLVPEEVGAVLDHRLDEPGGLGRAGADQDPPAGRNGADRLFGRRDLPAVTGLPVVLAHSLPIIGRCRIPRDGSFASLRFPEP